MTGLNIKNLSKSYKNYRVLESADWKVEKGIHWLKGGNGTGKTTLFKIIAGQLPFQGEISINGIALKQKPVNYRQLLSFAEAEPQYPSYITGNELLSYFCKLRKADRRSAGTLIEQFRMSDFMNNKIETYSSGMLKKLSLICAFTGDIKLYLLDEPLITIDTDAATVLYQHIKSRFNQGSIFLISSHQELDRQQIDLEATFEINDKKVCPC